MTEWVCCSGWCYPVAHSQTLVSRLLISQVIGKLLVSYSDLPAMSMVTSHNWQQWPSVLVGQAYNLLPRSVEWQWSSQWLSWSNVVVMMVSFFLLLTMAASELSIISSVLIRVKWLGKAAQYGSFRQILVKQTHKKSSIIEVIKPTAAASSSCPNLSENAKTAEWWRTAQGRLGGWVSHKIGIGSTECFRESTCLKPRQQ